MGNNKVIGNYGENLATEFLKKEGYQILARNYFTYHGEIDIIAKFKNEFIFCEVKTRTSIKYGFPSEAVNAYKQKHIKLATQYFLYKNNLYNEIIRFDIIEVYLINDKIRINHIKNVM